MNYSPHHQYVWDPWCVEAPGGKIHLYHLQVPRDDAGNGQRNQLGHAVSDDLIHWQECEPAFAPNPEDPDDDCQPWTGSTVWNDGKAWLFYTMRGSRTKCGQQAIGLAVSEDGYRFKRVATPLLMPDPKLFSTLDAPVRGTLDCRDFNVIKAPDRPGWYGYFATRRQGPKELVPTSVIAGCYSEDLIHWGEQKTIFQPRNCACVEVPSVFFFAGKWYLTALTGLFYGNFHSFGDKNIRNGTIYAVSDNPMGPFFEPQDNTLIGTMHAAAPLAGRAFQWRGQMYWIYTDRERCGANDCGSSTFGTFSTPKLLAMDENDLRIAYYPQIETLAEREQPLDLAFLQRQAELGGWGQIWKIPLKMQPLENGFRLENKCSTSALLADWRGDRFIFDADLDMGAAKSAGFVLRALANSWGAPGDYLRVIPEEQRIQYLSADGEFEECRQWPAARTGNLKVVSRKEHLEIYWNDFLVLAFPRYRNADGHVGFFTDSGSTAFRNIRFRTLK